MIFGTTVRSDATDDTVRCPYCEGEVSRRGVSAHIRMSRDEAHGGPDAVPTDYRPLQ